jgi:hypothetical protein
MGPIFAKVGDLKIDGSGGAPRADRLLRGRIGRRRHHAALNRAEAVGHVVAERGARSRSGIDDRQADAL